MKSTSACLSGLAVAFLAATEARAQEEVSPPLPAVVEPLPIGEAASPRLTWEALVDSYYQYNFGAGSSLAAPALRAFDLTSHSFALAYAELAATYGPDPVGFRIDIGYGHTGTVVNGSGASASGTGETNAWSRSLYGSALLVEQAYATARLGRNVTLAAGRFVTTAGAEVIESRDNWNYSRSLLFTGLPYLHTGLRLGVAFGEMLGVELSAVNGINNDPDNNAAKTVGLSVALTPRAGTKLVGTSYIGRESTGGGGRVSTLFDLVARHSFGEVFALSLNVDYSKTGEASWLGAALTGRLAPSHRLNLAARGEVVKSENGGYAGLTTDPTLYEVTLTAGVPVAPGFEVRGEGRADLSDQAIFPLGAVEPSRTQVTALLAFVAWLP